MFTRAQIFGAVLVLLGMFAAGFYTERALRTFIVHVAVECRAAPTVSI